MNKEIIYDREMNIQRCYSTEYQGMKVKYIDHMGNDLSVVNSAYASFGKMEHEYNPDKHDSLIQYLAKGMSSKDYKELCDYLARVEEVSELLEKYRNTPTHWSPFAHTCITLQCTVPIAIHAQLVKHTVGFNINTVSRRYVSTTPELFIPEFRSKPTGNIKQGSGDVITVVNPYKTIMNEDDTTYVQEYASMNQEKIRRLYREVCDTAIETYTLMVTDVDKGGLGIAPEQARFILPQGVMTEFVWTGNVASFARMFNQRTDSHSQKEIQDLAHMVGEIIKPLYPVSWNALTGN